MPATRSRRFSGRVDALIGHDLAQFPGVADLAFHDLFPVWAWSAAAMVVSRCRRSVRVRKSELTQM